MKCITCAKEFTPKRNPSQKNCSRSCNATYNNRLLSQKFTCPKCLICGKPTARVTRRKYCSIKCQGVASKGSKNPMWKGGRKRHSEGYIYVHLPEHPDCDVSGYMLEHRYVMSEIIGRRLIMGEIIHHINGIKDDNRPENLELLASQGEHLKKEGHGRTKQSHIENSTEKEIIRNKIKYRITITKF